MFLHYLLLCRTFSVDLCECIFNTVRLQVLVSVFIIHCQYLQALDSVFILHCQYLLFQDSAFILHCLFMMELDSVFILHCQHLRFQDSAFILHCLMVLSALVSVFVLHYQFTWYSFSYQLYSQAKKISIFCAYERYYIILKYTFT